jgi:hypothetical protein
MRRLQIYLISAPPKGYLLTFCPAWNSESEGLPLLHDIQWPPAGLSQIELQSKCRALVFDLYGWFIASDEFISFPHTEQDLSTTKHACLCFVVQVGKKALPPGGPCLEVNYPLRVYFDGLEPWIPESPLQLCFHWVPFGINNGALVPPVRELAL